MIKKAKKFMEKNPLKGVTKMNEADFAAIKLQNLLRKKEILLPNEIEMVCKDLSAEEKLIVIRQLQKLGISYREKMLHFDDKEVIGPETIREKELLSYLIRPEYVNTETDHIQIGSQFYEGITATGFPASVRENWLGKLIQEKGNVDFSIHIQPSSIRALEIHLNSQLKQVENDLYKYTQRGIHNPSLENRKQELLDQLNSLIKGEYKLYRMSLYLASKGESKQSAATVSQKILSAMHAEGIEASHARNYQEQLLKSIIPTGTDFLKTNQILVPGPAAAASFPFSSSFYEVDEEDGMLLGFNDNGIPIGKSLWKLPKYIGAVLGSTGSGKSYASKAFLLNDQMVNSSKVFVLDPEGEYVRMAKNIKGAQVISLNKDSNTIPNLLNLMGSNLTDKLVSLPRVFDVLLDGVSDTQKPLLEQCLIDVYRVKGITEKNTKSWKKNAPILSDLMKVMQKNKKKLVDINIKSDYEVLISKLSRYTRGIFKFINQSGKNINLDSDFIVFEFKEMTEEIRPVMMLVLLEFIKTKFTLDNSKKMLVLDEAWRMLKSRHEAMYVEGFARTFRKRNGALLLITQSVAELKGSPEGKAFLSNTSFRYILKTEKVVLDETCELFGLNDSEKEVIGNARPGEGILVWGNRHHKINIEVDPETHNLITTNPEEMKKVEAEEKKAEGIKEKIVKAVKRAVKRVKLKKVRRKK